MKRLLRFTSATALNNVNVCYSRGRLPQQDNMIM